MRGGAATTYAAAAGRRTLRGRDRPAYERRCGGQVGENATPFPFPLSPFASMHGRIDRTVNERVIATYRARVYRVGS